MCNDNVTVRISLDDGVTPPSYAHEGDAGMDLRANEDVWLQPSRRHIVKTGIRLAIPSGYEGQIRPRSGLAAKSGVTVINSPGTIDSNYRGEVGVPLVNLSKKPVAIAKGDRIAQLVIKQVPRVELEVADSLDDTVRGEGGFGSTGR